jgi:nucleotide-binding universal stress UspA family protein
VILVATDGSDQALAAVRPALELATHSGDDLLIVVVWRELHAALGIPVGLETEREWAHEVAEETAAIAREAGIESELAIRHGRAGEEICAAARDRGVRLIVMGSRGLSAVERTLLGSVSAYVLQHAPCPVLVARAPDTTS